MPRTALRTESANWTRSPGKMPEIAENSPEIPVIDVLTSEQLDLALGRSNVIHAALLAGSAGKTFLSRSQILVRYRMADDDKTAGHAAKRIQE